MTNENYLKMVLDHHEKHKSVRRKDVTVLELNPGDKMLLKDCKQQYAKLIGMKVTYGDTIAWLYHLAQDFIQKQKEEKDKELC